MKNKIIILGSGLTYGKYEIAETAKTLVDLQRQGTSPILVNQTGAHIENGWNAYVRHSLQNGGSRFTPLEKLEVTAGIVSQLNHDLSVAIIEHSGRAKVVENWFRVDLKHRKGYTELSDMYTPTLRSEPFRANLKEGVMPIASCLGKIAAFGPESPEIIQDPLVVAEHLAWFLLGDVYHIQKTPAKILEMTGEMA